MQNFTETKEIDIIRALLVLYFRSDEYFGVFTKSLPESTDAKTAIETAVGMIEGFSEKEISQIGSAASAEEARMIRHELIIKRVLPPEKEKTKLRFDFLQRQREKKLKDVIIKNDLSEDQLKELKQALADGLDFKTVLDMGKHKITASRMKQIREIFLVRQKMLARGKEDNENG